MKIRQEVFNKISTVANSMSLEIGGILGSSENGIVTDMIADLPDNVVGCKFDYSPNIDFLNAQIENWSENNIVFLGLFHTHFSGSKNLSDADVEYIKAIMNASKGIVEYLYFPLFTLPNNELTVYKAYFNDADIVIDKDELIIV
ncbi:MAG: hypothetical protein IJZ16_13065 [Clostridia bacterium]|nr:hypothetical protein [Clostridia bacterium]